MVEDNYDQNPDEQQVAAPSATVSPNYPANTMPPPPPAVDIQPLYGNAAPGAMPYSYARPFWYVAFMTLITQGAYPIVWFYRAWKVLMVEYNLKGNAVVNTIFIIFCAFSFYRYAFSLGAKNGYHSTMSANSVAGLFIIIEIIGSVSSGIEGINDSLTIYSLVIFAFMLLSLIPLREGTLAMNSAYTNLQPGTRMRNTLSPWSIVFVIIGTILWLFYLGNGVLTKL